MTASVKTASVTSVEMIAAGLIAGPGIETPGLLNLARACGKLPYIVDIDPHMLSPWIPPTLKSAAERVRWLIERIYRHDLEGTSRASALLARWARNPNEFQWPEAVAYGHAIIGKDGFFLGNPNGIGYAQTIVYDESLGLAEATLAGVCAVASAKCLSVELEKANGMVSRLLPDTANWLNSGCGNRLFSRSEAGRPLADLSADLKEMAVPYGVSEQNDHLAAVAVSPSCFDERLVAGFEPR